MKIFSWFLCIWLVLLPVVSAKCFSQSTANAQFEAGKNHFGNQTVKNTYLWPRTNSRYEALSQCILLPNGFKRETLASSSFEYWLQNLPLKAGTPPIHLFDGRLKNNQNVHVAVADIDVGNKDLQQCADAIIRLRAEYLYTHAIAQPPRFTFDDIHFNFTSGFKADFRKWSEGYRPAINGNAVSWVKKSQPDSSYQSFREYLNVVFTYAGTASLSKELTPVHDVHQIKIGDVFVQGGFPGHAEIVVDVAIHQATGQKVFLLAQSFMPAQEIHILKNPGDLGLSPWYSVEFGDMLVTPEWTFRKTDLKRFG